VLRVDRSAPTAETAALGEETTALTDETARMLAETSVRDLVAT
jgi:hypothetical protein